MKDWHDAFLGWKKVTMFGRKVKMRVRSGWKPVKECDDCGEPSVFEVKEADGKMWHYCGICEVG